MTKYSNMSYNKIPKSMKFVRNVLRSKPNTEYYHKCHERMEKNKFCGKKAIKSCCGILRCKIHHKEHFLYWDIHIRADLKRQGYVEDNYGRLVLPKDLEKSNKIPPRIFSLIGLLLD